MKKLQRIISAILDEFEYIKDEEDVRIEEHEYERHNFLKDGVYTWKYIIITAIVFVVIIVLSLL